MKLFVIVVLFYLSLNSAFSKKFTRCELATELKRQGFPVTLLPDWVCLVENESSCNTAAKGPKNNDGSYDWGLFQINDRYWCSTNGKPGKDCNIKCEDMLTDDITVAANCAKKVYNVHKFKAWYAYADKCVGKLPDLSSCKL